MHEIRILCGQEDPDARIFQIRLVQFYGAGQTPGFSRIAWSSFRGRVRGLKPLVRLGQQYESRRDRQGRTARKLKDLAATTHAVVTDGWQWSGPHF